MASSLNIYYPTTFGGIGVYINSYDMRKIKKIDQFVRDSPRLLRGAFRSSSRDFGQRVVNAAKACIRSSTPPRGVSWPPLSDNYVRNYHQFKGGDNTMFWWNSEFLAKSIGIYEEGVEVLGSNKKSSRLYIGLPLQATHPHPGYPGSRNTRNLTLQRIAKFIENGVKGVPPRPLFRPLFNQMGGSKALQKSIKNKIQEQVAPYFNS